MLIDLTKAEPSAAQLADLANELRLPMACLDDQEGASRLSRLVAAASAIVERRTGLVSLTRQVEWRVDAWSDPKKVSLPLHPVTSIDAIGVIHDDGERTAESVNDYRCVTERGSPTVVRVSRESLPAIATGCLGFIGFTVGHGASWTDVPADLRLATTLIAAALHDRGSDAATDVQLPFGALALLEPYRRLRLWG